MLSSEVENRIRDLAAKTEGPFYFYDLGDVHARAQKTIERLQSSHVRLYYSLKANSADPILKAMKEKLMSADVASGGELAVAIAAGFAPDEISFTGPGKFMSELKTAIELGVGMIVAESSEELLQINELASSLAKTANVSIRLTPGQRVNHVGRLLVDQPTQFGVVENQWNEVVKTLKKCRNLSLVGTHSHLQSQILSADHALRNVEFALQASEEFRAKLGFKQFQQVGVGGGFGVPYSVTAQEFDIDHFSVGFKLLAKKFHSLNETSRLAVELGRYLVAPSGVFVARILNTKPQTKSMTYAIASGGYAQCQIACGIGQTVRANLPIEILAMDGGRRTIGKAGDPLKPSMTVSIVGPTCYSQDVLANDLTIDKIAAGDLICVKNVGAYGAKFSPIEFLRQPLANEYFERVL